MIHKPVERRLNIRREIQRVREDPMAFYLEQAFSMVESNSPKTRYKEAYNLYFRSMERVLHQVSTTVRYRKGPYYVRKYGGKYSPGQKRLAEKWRKLSPFLELEISTCILHTRILLDRTVALSRAFLQGSTLPSFNSFSDHKQFFLKRPDALPGHERYGRYMREETSWFDIPIKFVRDKLLVHQGPKHHKHFAIGWEKDDNLIINFNVLGVPKGSPVRHITFNPWRMSLDVESFLRWFSVYGINAYAPRANNRLKATPKGGG